MIQTRGKGIFAFQQMLAVFTLLFCSLTAHAVAPGTNTTIANPSPQTQVADYVQNRQAYQAKLETEKSRYETERDRLNAEIANINRVLANSDVEIRRLRSETAAKGHSTLALEAVKNGLLVILFPLLGLATLLNTLGMGYLGNVAAFQVLFLPVTAINLFLYVMWKEKVVWGRYRWIIVGVLVFLLTGFSAPLFAADAEKEKEIAASLDTAIEILGKSDHQRFIAVLEGRVRDPVDLPALASGDPLLRPSRQVFLDTAEYYFTLAALHTHEGNIGRAVDAIKRLSASNIQFRSAQRAEIIANSIKFLMKHKHTDSAGSLVDQLVGRISEVPKLLELSAYLKDNQMDSSAEQVLGMAIGRAATVADLTELVRFFIRQGESEKASESLRQAALKAQSMQDILQVAGLAIRRNNELVMGDLIAKLPASLPERMRMVDLLLENGKREGATNVFSDSVGSINRRTPNYRQHLMFLAQQAMDRELPEQALSAVSKLSLYMGEEAFNNYIALPNNMGAHQDIPEPEMISIPLFFGVLNEELNFDNKAESAYIRVVLRSLQQISSSYGYSMPESLNDFYLLGRMWESGNKAELLAKLDEVYSLLEDRHIEALRQRNEASLQSLRQQVEASKQYNRQRLETIASLENQEREANREAFFLSIAAVTTIGFLLLVLTICVWNGYRYSKQLSAHKTYGFLAKAIETLGWIRVMSVIGVVTGLITIVIAQLLLIFQRIQEDMNQLGDPSKSISR